MSKAQLEFSSHRKQAYNHVWAAETVLENIERTTAVCSHGANSNDMFSFVRNRALSVNGYRLSFRLINNVEFVGCGRFRLINTIWLKRWEAVIVVFELNTDDNEEWRPVISVRCSELFAEIWVLVEQKCTDHNVVARLCVRLYFILWYRYMCVRAQWWVIQISDAIVPCPTCWCHSVNFKSPE